MRVACMTTRKNNADVHAELSGKETSVLNAVSSSPVMKERWKIYQNDFPKAAGIAWEEVVESVRALYALAEPG